jgi:hypothetical protein
LVTGVISPGWLNSSKMKKLLIIALLFASCQKEDCKTCKWTRSINHGLVLITVKEEKVCSAEKVTEINGKAQWIYDSSGQRVLTTCNCE